MGGFSINSNITSLQAREYLRSNSEFQSKTISRVTSGLRITTSGDDAAGLAIANGFRSDISVISQGIRNANDGLSQLQIVDGGLNNISKLIDRARTLATQSATGTFSGSRAVLNSEFQSVLTEIDRQAQTIGLNIGGSLNKNLSVFIGGGSGATNAAKISNGSIAVDLSTSAVDTRSLGLSGVQAAGVTGTDISTSSSTSVSTIIADSANTSDAATAGFTDFYFRGAGFSDTNRIKVSANLSGVTNTSNLVDAINTAIDSAGNAGSQQATAFKNAGVRAIVVQDTQGDGTVKERLGFTSSSAAFQVEAGDRTANALLGNFSTGATGKEQKNVFVGGTAAAAAGTTAATAGNIIVRLQGGGLSGPVDLKLEVTGGTTTVGQVLADFTSQIGANSALQAAGIEVVSANVGEQIVLQNSQGERFEVLTAGDTSDILGLGSYRLANAATATSLDYTSITGTGGTFTAVANQFEFSINGSSTVIDTGSFTPAAATVAAYVNSLNQFFSTSAAAQNAGLVASADGGQLKIASSNGTAFRVNAVAGATHGLGPITAGAVTANKTDSLRSDTVGTIGFGAGETLTLTANGTAYEVDLNADASLSDVVASINGTAGLSGIALAAEVDGKLVITGIAANDKISVTGSSSASVLTTLGLELGDTNIADKSSFNSGGSYASELGSDKDVYQFSQFRNGIDSQTLNIVANDASGAQRSLAVTLRNDSIARNARSLDEAIATINSALQASGDVTLKQLVAVKESATDDRKEGIRFISNLANFRVSVGTVATSTAASEVGIFDGTTGTSVLGQGLLTAATQTTGGSQTDISSQANAEAAVGALAEAVQKLGTSQAVVGRGQNQFTFAVNLAQSQVTNLSAAESRIRDADLATEAANLTRAQITLQAGVAALAQANSAPQQILSLLRG
jgi:flagellin